LVTGNNIKAFLKEAVLYFFETASFIALYTLM